MAHFCVGYMPDHESNNNTLNAPFQDRIEALTQHVERRLDQVLAPADTTPQRLHEAMRYAVFNGGKRIRPLLVYAAGECTGAAQSALDSPAVAIELIHAFSLVHDDLPAMDDDDLRRGKPTLHIAYDEATAILAADALQPLAFGAIAEADAIDAGVRCKLAGLIAHACGSVGMTGGQALDLAAEGSTLNAADLEFLYSLKTGALIHASIVSAGLLAESVSDADFDALDDFGRRIGIAFQIQDDILDVEGETAVIGKPVGSDAGLEKATYPSLFGVEASRQRCRVLLEEALELLAPFGHRGDSLAWLARFIVDRKR